MLSPSGPTWSSIQEKSWSRLSCRSWQACVEMWNGSMIYEWQRD
jgi:hypothetical protein